MSDSADKNALPSGPGSSGSPSPESSSPPPKSGNLTSFLLVVLLYVLPSAVLLSFLIPHFRDGARREAQRLNCVRNLQDIGHALNVWRGTHADADLFHSLTNEADIIILNGTGQSALEPNACKYFQSLSNELSSTEVLVCPGDPTKSPASSFSHLTATNVTYLIYVPVGANMPAAAQTPVLLCPIHRNVLYADGSVARVSNAEMDQILHHLAQKR